MADRIRIIKHEAVPLCGSFEVRFPDGGPLNTSILMTCRVTGCGLIWLIELPQGAAAEFLAGRNRTRWIRNSRDR